MIDLLAAVAWAQPGQHLSRGDVVVVPDLGLFAEFRTNAYESPTDAIPAGSFLVRPALRLDARGRQYTFAFTGDWELRRFVITGQPDLPPGTLDRYGDFAVNAAVDAFTQGVIGIRASEDLRQWNFPADASLAAVPYDSQLRNTAYAALRLGPPADFTVLPGVRWTWNAFQLPGPDDRSVFNQSTSLGPVIDAAWRFLPSTQIVAGGEWTRVTWGHEQLPASEDNGLVDGIVVPDSTLMKVRAGIDGRFTRSFLARAIVGYGSDEVDPVAGAPPTSATGIDGLLVDSSIGFLLTPSRDGRPGSALTAGYLRDFQPSYFTSWLGLDEGFLDLHLRMGRARPGLRADLGSERYHGAVTRTDLVWQGAADVSVIARPWLNVSAGGFYTQRLTVHTSTPEALPVDFNDFGVQAGFTLEY